MITVIIGLSQTGKTTLINDLKVNKDLIILDEPTTLMKLEEAKIYMRILNLNHDKTKHIYIITHQLETLQELTEYNLINLKRITNKKVTISNTWL